MQLRILYVVFRCFDNVYDSIETFDETLDDDLVLGRVKVVGTLMPDETLQDCFLVEILESTNEIARLAIKSYFQGERYDPTNKEVILSLT